MAERALIGRLAQPAGGCPLPPTGGRPQGRHGGVSEVVDTRVNDVVHACVEHGEAKS